MTVSTIRRLKREVKSLCGFRNKPVELIGGAKLRGDGDGDGDREQGRFEFHIALSAAATEVLHSILALPSSGNSQVYGSRP